jgi:hypothetical protein
VIVAPPAGLQDPELDKMIADAGTILDDQARKAAYKAIADRMNVGKVAQCPPFLRNGSGFGADAECLSPRGSAR